MSFFFIQMSDPQFGMFASRDAAPPDGSFPETELFEKAIAAANRLRPAFVVITGDLVQVPTDEKQHQELTRIAGLLDEDIPLKLVPGNADLGNTPTDESLSRFRNKFGRDYYSFDHENSHFTVVNSCLAFDPSEVPSEWEAELTFLTEDLAGAGESKHRILFMHHPLFGEDPTEADNHMSIPQAQRKELLNLAHETNVAAVFAGHWHRPHEVSAGDLMMVITGAVGYPIDGPSGLRIVKVYDDHLEHEYFGMDAIPDTVSM